MNTLYKFGLLFIIISLSLIVGINKIYGQSNNPPKNTFVLIDYRVTCGRLDASTKWPKIFPFAEVVLSWRNIPVVYSKAESDGIGLILYTIPQSDEEQLLSLYGSDLENGETSHPYNQIIKIPPNTDSITQDANFYYKNCPENVERDFRIRNASINDIEDEEPVQILPATIPINIDFQVQCGSGQVEPIPLAGYTVNLYDDGGNIIATEYSDQNGKGYLQYTEKSPTYVRKYSIGAENAYGFPNSTAYSLVSEKYEPITKNLVFHYPICPDKTLDLHPGIPMRADFEVSCGPAVGSFPKRVPNSKVNLYRNGEFVAEGYTDENGNGSIIYFEPNPSAYMTFSLQGDRSDINNPPAQDIAILQGLPNYDPIYTDSSIYYDECPTFYPEQGQTDNPLKVQVDFAVSCGFASATPPRRIPDARVYMNRVDSEGFEDPVWGGTANESGEGTIYYDELFPHYGISYKVTPGFETEGFVEPYTFALPNFPTDYVHKTVNIEVPICPQTITAYTTQENEIIVAATEEQVEDEQNQTPVTLLPITDSELTDQEISF